VEIGLPAPSSLQFLKLFAVRVVVDVLASSRIGPSREGPCNALSISRDEIAHPEGADCHAAVLHGGRRPAPPAVLFEKVIPGRV